MRSPDEWMAELLAAESAGALPPLLFFWGHTPRDGHPGPWVLSQWWGAPFEVEGVVYPTAEAFMMAEKARLFGDETRLAEILAADHPAAAKDAGRRVTPFDSAVWDAHRYDAVVRGNVAKFSQHPDLRAYLASTAPRVLVEASPADRVWGIGLSAGDAAARTPSTWRGSNLLGFALTEVRERLS
ncbi:MAG TPA: NADAR family protein [Frankiaceae bacterium]|nr:NADAR family protein [Frankiaceae bacterium]